MYVSEDEALLVETVTKFVSDEVKGAARSWETLGIPSELWTSLGELGLLAITTPEECGGAGLGLRELGLVAGYLAQGDLALAWAVTRHNQALALLATSDHADLDTFLAGTARLDWSHGITETARGADAVVVVHQDNVSLHQCSTLSQDLSQIGARGLGTSMEVSQSADVKYPAKVDHKSLEGESRLLAAAIGWGLGKSALGAATNYALERQQFGKPIAQFQAIQWKLADGAMLLEAAELLIESALHTPNPTSAAMALKASLDAVTKLVDDGLQTHGGYGYTEDFDIEKYYRDAQFLAGQLGTRRRHSLQITQDILNQARD